VQGQLLDQAAGKHGASPRACGVHPQRVVVVRILFAAMGGCACVTTMRETNVVYCTDIHCPGKGEGGGFEPLPSKFGDKMFAWSQQTRNPRRCAPHNQVHEMRVSLAGQQRAPC
jgi:hypothetical protein